MVRRALDPTVSNMQMLRDSFGQPSDSELVAADGSTQSPHPPLSQCHFPLGCEGEGEITLDFVLGACSVGAKSKQATKALRPKRLPAKQLAQGKAVCKATTVTPKLPKKVRSKTRKRKRQETKAAAEQDPETEAAHLWELLNLHEQAERIEQEAAACERQKRAAAFQVQPAPSQLKSVTVNEQALAAAEKADAEEAGPCTPEQQPQAAAPLSAARQSTQSCAGQQCSPALQQQAHHAAPHLPQAAAAQHGSLAPQQSAAASTSHQGTSAAQHLPQTAAHQQAEGTEQHVSIAARKRRRRTADLQAQLAAGQHKPFTSDEQALAAEKAEADQPGPCTPEQQEQAGVTSSAAGQSVHAATGQQASALQQQSQAGVGSSAAQHLPQAAAGQQGSRTSDQSAKAAAGQQGMHVAQHMPQSAAGQQGSLAPQQPAEAVAGQQGTFVAQHFSRTAGHQQGLPAAQQATQAAPQQQASAGTQQLRAQPDAHPEAGQQASAAAQQQTAATGDGQQGDVHQRTPLEEARTRDEKGQGRVLSLIGDPGIGTAILYGGDLELPDQTAYDLLLDAWLTPAAVLAFLDKVHQSAFWFMCLCLFMTASNTRHSYLGRYYS